MEETLKTVGYLMNTFNVLHLLDEDQIKLNISLTT